MLACTHDCSVRSNNSRRSGLLVGSQLAMQCQESLVCQ